MATWTSVIPAIIVLIWAITTHQVLISLILGILSAAFIAHPTDPIAAGSTAITTVYHQITTWDNIIVFAFLICIGVIIELMRQTGAIQAYTARIQNTISTPFRAQLSTLLGTFGFFLDDYLNAFTLGSIMAPLFDRLNISRTKLAYLINATVPSLCIMIPATTWTAMIISYLRVTGIGNDAYIPNDPFFTYLSIIIFAIYPILSIATAYYMVLTQTDYGFLASEQQANATHNASQDSESSEQSNHISSLECIMPMAIFIISSIISFLHSGSATIIGGSNPLLTALQDADALFALFTGAALSAVISSIYFYHSRHITQKQIGSVIKNGYLLMQGSLCVLLLAWSLSSILTQELNTAEYLANMFTANIAMTWLPLVIFLLTTIITASTGSAWGTIALMVPLTVRLLLETAPDTMPIYLETISYAYPTIGAALAGSIAGGHFSPISDATIVASTSSGASHIDHVKSQMQYSIPPLIGSLCAYGVVGYLDMSYYMLAATTITIGAGVAWATNMICKIIWRA